jgi:Ca-activated chloride channel family protein
MELTLIPERPAIPVNTAVTLPVLVRLTAPTVPQMARKPLNLCLVIDRSGSMAGPKLQQTITAAQFVVQRLAPTDLLSVVQFDERVKVVISPRHPTNKEFLCRVLGGITDGGSTNLSGGWLRGADCLREQASPEYVNRLLLLTDGQANHGIADPAVLVKHAAELTEDGITTTTLGYGEDFNEDLLTSLADAGRGNAYHVETADQAPVIFAKELEGLLAIAAQNVRLTITPRTPGVEVEVLTDQRRRPGPDGITIEVDDLVSEESRSLLLALRVPSLAAEGLAVLASVTLTYMDVAHGIQAKESAQDLVLGVVPIDQAAAIQADAAVTREFLILRAARVLGAAIAQADAGDLPGALTRLKDFLAIPAVAQATDPELRAARRRVKDYLRQLEDEGFTQMNRKQMLYSSREMGQGKTQRPKLN